MENGKPIKLSFQSQLNSLLKELLDNMENVEMIAILDQDGLPYASLMKSEDDEVISAISASFDNFVSRIKREFSGSVNRIRNIMNLGDMTFYFASAGDEAETAVLTKVGNKDVVENEMRIFGDFAADKITAILRRTEEVSVEIPRLVKSMVKFGKIPSGEYSMKLIVCGDYAVGKTSLINRLVDDTFEENYIATLGVNISKKTVKLFADNHVLSERELEARYEIRLEHYTKKIQIESRVLGDLSMNHIIPIAIRYQNTLIDNVKGLKQVLDYQTYGKLSHNQMETITDISEHVDKIKTFVHKMIEARKVANRIEDIVKKTDAYCKHVFPFFNEIRVHVDKLEMLVDDELWPLPKYRELLFMR